MFSKENRKFLTLVIAIVVIAIAAMLIMRSMVGHGQKDSTMMISGIAVSIILSLVGLARQEVAMNRANQHRDKIETKVEVAASSAVVAAENAVEAKKEASETKAVVVEIEKHSDGKLKEALAMATPAQVVMPKTPEELESLVEGIVKKTAAICAEEQRKRDAARGEGI